MGNVVRVGPLQSGEVVSVATSKSHAATKSYALPLKISSICRGVKFNSVPKNTSDKKLVLDAQGNIVTSAANLPDFKSSPILSRIVKDKLVVMRIESDRIKSAVEHGPVYDQLFAKLAEMSVPVHSDVYLQPIQLFRDEYNNNAQFQEETSEFARQALAAQPLPELWATASGNNNNNNNLAKHKGTVFAPNGEVWGWRHSPTTAEHSGSLRSTRISAQYSTTSAAAPPAEPQQTAPLRDYRRHLSAELSPGAAAEAADRLAALALEELDPASAEFNARLHAGGVPCQRCARAMFAGEVAVKAERAGRRAIWHPQCFACRGCGELLADLVYFYHGGEIYCARDLAAVLEVPRCAGCDELIFTRPYTAAEGRAFHVHHFCCYRCDAPLGGRRYVPHDRTGLPCCLACYELHYAERCRACGEVIGPEQQGVSLGGGGGEGGGGGGGAHWHAACFACGGAACGKSLLGARFLVKQDTPFCSVPCARTRIQ